MYFEGHAIKGFIPGSGKPVETLAFCKDQDTARVIVGSINAVAGLVAALEIYQTYIGPDGGFQPPPDMKTKGMLFDKAQEAIERYLAHSRIEPDYTKAKALAYEGKRVQAIKEIRMQSGMGLKEALDLHDSWPEWQAFQASQTQES